MNEVMKAIGFHQSENDLCLFTKFHKGSYVYVVLYVDDFFVFHNDVSEKNKLFDELKKHFSIKDLGNAKQMLGMNLTRDANSIYLNQSDFVDDILQTYGFSNAKGIKTPMEHNLYLFKAEGTCDADDVNGTFQAVIGSLMYLATHTRPDIAHVVSYLSQFNNAHNSEHWNQVKRVLRYLVSTRTLSLRYSKTGNLNFEAFCDSSWGNDVETGRSFAGHVFKLAGGPVVWESRKQKSVTRSSCEAEYVAASDASAESKYLRRFLAELLRRPKAIVTIYIDSQSAMKMAENCRFRHRSKHISIKYHFIRERISKGKLRLEYVPTAEMTADILTKGLPRSEYGNSLIMQLFCLFV